MPGAGFLALGKEKWKIPTKESLTLSILVMTKSCIVGQVVMLLLTISCRVTRVIYQLEDLGWVYFGLTLILAVPLSGWFCLSRWHFGRIGWATGQNGRTPNSSPRADGAPSRRERKGKEGEVICVWLRARISLYDLRSRPLLTHVLNIRR